MQIDDAELCDIFCVLADSKDEYSEWRYFKMKTKDVTKDDLIIALVGLTMGVAKMAASMMGISQARLFRELANTHRKMHNG